MSKDIELAILFADVVGSTQLYEMLGDAKAREMVGICIDIMKGATERHGGTVIKTMGDEVMATFALPDEAINAASQMQREISLSPALQAGNTHVAIRIGCHFGPVVLEHRDVFGAAVHTANRMTSQAKAGQIMTTVTMVERLSADWKSAVRQIDVATLKGRSHEVALYEVLWQTEDITSMLPAIALANRETHRPRRLRLRFQGEEIVLDDQRTHVTIGRADDNDVIVKGNLISRLHARIEASKARFMLIDQSTNGTFVHGASGDEQFVRRDSMPISGEGLIGLGRAPERDSSQTIRFVCEE
ncbi:MAG: adenylate/guanylate cyclase domain-containing protein [Proteobacteria bacterium]|nr:adenylate/guanylate cyclase domain-containing protein [Pseudomonadota bacterium]